MVDDMMVHSSQAPKGKKAISKRLFLVVVVAGGLIALLGSVLLEASATADKVYEVVRMWHDRGLPATPGWQARNWLAEQWWLGPLRPSHPLDPVMECVAQRDFSWWKMMAVSREARRLLSCLEDHVARAELEHDAFTARVRGVALALACCLATLSAWAVRRWFSRRGDHVEEQDPGHDNVDDDGQHDDQPAEELTAVTEPDVLPTPAMTETRPMVEEQEEKREDEEEELLTVPEQTLDTPKCDEEERLTMADEKVKVTEVEEEEVLPTFPQWSPQQESLKEENEITLIQDEVLSTTAEQALEQQENEEKDVPKVKEENVLPMAAKQTMEAQQTQDSVPQAKRAKTASPTPSSQPRATPSLPPWQYPRLSYDGTLRALHQEVLDFERWAGGSEAEFQRRMSVVHEVRRVVAALWPAARVEVTGSLASGLYLPDSDVDLTLVGEWPPSPQPLMALRDALLQQGAAAPTSLKVLLKATVPLVKFTHPNTGLAVDVSLGNEVAVRAAALVSSFRHQFKGLTPLALLVRYYLRQQNLAEVFTGGVSSYAVTLMATSLLQLQVPPSEQEDLARLVLRFFSFYGYEFDYQGTGISVLEGGRYLGKEEVPTVMPGGHRRSDLCIQDPLTPGNDVGRSSFRIWEVRDAFQRAYRVLQPALHAPAAATASHSLLARLLKPGPPPPDTPNGRPQRGGRSGHHQNALRQRGGRSGHHQNALRPPHTERRRLDDDRQMSQPRRQFWRRPGPKK